MVDPSRSHCPIQIKTLQPFSATRRLVCLLLFVRLPTSVPSFIQAARPDQLVLPSWRRSGYMTPLSFRSFFQPFYFQCPFPLLNFFRLLFSSRFVSTVYRDPPSFFVTLRLHLLMGMPLVCVFVFRQEAHYLFLPFYSSLLCVRCR